MRGLVALSALLALAAPAAADHGGDPHVLADLVETVEDPTNPSLESVKDPCWARGECAGCGPDLLEWIVGPIYCP